MHYVEREDPGGGHPEPRQGVAVLPGAELRHARSQIPGAVSCRTLGRRAPAAARTPLHKPFAMAPETLWHLLTNFFLRWCKTAIVRPESADSFIVGGQDEGTDDGVMEALDPGVVEAGVMRGPPGCGTPRSGSTAPRPVLTGHGRRVPTGFRPQSGPASLAMRSDSQGGGTTPVGLLSGAKRTPRFAADLPKEETGQPGRVIVGRGGAACHTSRVSVTILDREMYTEAAAARLLRVAPSTLHWWLEGRPPRYRPVIRVEPTGSRNVTWAEFGTWSRCR